VAITQIAFVLFSKGEREIILGQLLQNDFNTPVLDIALMLAAYSLCSSDNSTPARRA
jgi:hypothetical protein